VAADEEQMVNRFPRVATTPPTHRHSAVHRPPDRTTATSSPHCEVHDSHPVTAIRGSNGRAERSRGCVSARYTCRRGASLCIAYPPLWGVLPAIMQEPLSPSAAAVVSASFPVRPSRFTRTSRHHSSKSRAHVNHLSSTWFHAVWRPFHLEPKLARDGRRRLPGAVSGMTLAAKPSTTTKWRRFSTGLISAASAPPDVPAAV
jgi:hypothetical protein